MPYSHGESAATVLHRVKGRSKSQPGPNRLWFDRHVRLTFLLPIACGSYMLTATARGSRQSVSRPCQGSECTCCEAALSDAGPAGFARRGRAQRTHPCAGRGFPTESNPPVLVVRLMLAYQVRRLGVNEPPDHHPFPCGRLRLLKRRSLGQMCAQDRIRVGEPGCSPWPSSHDTMSQRLVLSRDASPAGKDLSG